MTMMYPAIRDGVHARQIKDGVVIKSTGAAFKIKGRGLYDFYAKVLNLLTGDTSMEQFHELLNEKQAFYFDSLVEQLQKYRMVFDVNTSKTVTISNEVYRKYGATIEYFKEKLDNHEATFIDWTAQKLVLWGDGQCYNAMRELLHRSGLEMRDGRDGNGTNLALGSLDTTQTGLGMTCANINVNEVAGNAIFDSGVKHLFIYDAVKEETLEGFRSWFKSNDCAPIEIGVHGGIGVIGPDPVKGLATMADFFGRNSLTAIEPVVFGFSSALFFRALAARTLVELMDDVIEPDKHNFIDRVIVVRPDLSTQYCPLFPLANHSRPLNHTGINRVNKVEDATDHFNVIYSQTELLFHPVTGLFKRKEHSDTPQVPFYHGEIEIRYPAYLERDNEFVVDWGFDFKDATINSTLAAITLYASVVSDYRAPAPSDASWESDINADAWFKRALASPLREIIDAGYTSPVNEWQVDFSSCSNLEIFQIFKTLRVFIGDTFSVEVRHYPDFNLYDVAVHVGSNLAARRASFSLAEAISKSLGEVLSHHQLGKTTATVIGAELQVGTSEVISINELLSGDISNLNRQHIETALKANNIGYVEHIFDAEPAFSSCGFYAGYITLEI